MKNNRRLLVILMVFIGLGYSTNLSSQNRLPNIYIEDINGNGKSLSEYNPSNKPLLIIFWATWCNPCIEELENISDIMAGMGNTTDFKLITICTDDSRSSAAVKAFVNGKRWEFDVLLDPNQEAMRSLNVTVIPQYFIYDTDGVLHKKHTGYIPGDEELIFEELTKLVDKNEN